MPAVKKDLRPSRRSDIHLNMETFEIEGSYRNEQYGRDWRAGEHKASRK
jgi:hypothetical protein